jgi:hypothetical protein
MQTKVKIEGSKVTKQDIEANIVDVLYKKMGLKTTICIVTLCNGHEFIGTSACVDPANYDATIGRQVAYDNAIDQVWPHLGAILQDRMYEAYSDPRERVIEEHAELFDKIQKLKSMDNSIFLGLSEVKRTLLTDQLVFMEKYREILLTRLSIW